VVNLGVNYRPTGQWELALFGRRVSSLFVNDQNTQSIPALVNLDGFVRYRVTRSTDLTLSIQNIADRKQAEWALPNAGGIVLFAPPRTATLGIRTAF
jgi:outer membrane receptor protein involved in Fe transport